MKSNYIIILFFLTSILSAQRFKVLSGALKNVKGIKEYNVTFDYSNLIVHDFESEEAFLAEKMSKRSNIEGEAEKFKKDWYEDRANKYEPMFIEYFNVRFPKGELKCDKNPSFKYTIQVKTTWIYPGYSLVAVEQPAKISAIITVVETAKPQNVLVSLEFDKSIGFPQGQFEFDQGHRIGGAYQKLAKNMVMQFKRFL